MNEHTKEEATAKLNSELEEAQRDSFPVNRIRDHLIGFMENDPTFISIVMQPQKTLKKCVAHVFDTVRKKYGTSCAVEDSEVYEICRSYYELDDAEIERKKAEAEEKRKAEAAERAKKAAAQKAAEPPKQAVEKKSEKKNGPEQMSLFDF